MSYELAEPAAGALIESLRGFGYTPETAIADLIDNSISASARNVWIQIEWNGEDSYISIRDDGEGMSEKRLVEAMRLGSQSPLQERKTRDLGRFGLGLKTASLSQARRLTVLTRCRGGASSIRRWDLDYITATNQWRLLLAPTPGSESRLGMLDAQKSGTIVLWEGLDRIVGRAKTSDVKAHKRFLNMIAEIDTHLGMVFHRFMTKRALRLHIWINGSAVTPWDPFLRESPATQSLGEETLFLAGNPIIVRPYVLPHHSKITREVHEAGAGPGGWNARQGFYVYRNERLLVAGDWLGLPFTKEEHYKLARIQLDIPNSLDQEWQIDVRKSRAWPPGSLREDLRRIANMTRERAVSVYRQRGKVIARKSSASYVFLWQRIVKYGKVSYRLNREHPLVHDLLQLPPSYRKRVAALLRLAEETVPIPLIALDHAEKPEEQAAPFETANPGEIQSVLLELYRALREGGLSAYAARNRLMIMEPFHLFPELIAALDDAAGLEEDS